MLYTPGSPRCGSLRGTYDSNSDQLLRIEGESWSALYNETTGQLLTCGDTYNVDELIFTLLGIHKEQHSDFLRGTSREAAPTIEALREWQTERDLAIRRAVDLEAQAAALIVEATELRASAR